MKQIIIVTNHKDRYQKDIPESSLYVTWCDFSVDALLAVRDRSNLIFLLMDHEKYDDLNNMALYLRDLCLEMEKYVYMYGNKEDVDTMKSKIPAIFIKKTMYSFSHFDLLMDLIVQEEVIAENGKPVFLLVDDDNEYSEKLRVHLDQHFRVMISRFDPEEIYKLILTIAAKSKSPGFHYYYLTDTDNERNTSNSGSDVGSISFSKEMEIERIARYFISRVE